MKLAWRYPEWWSLALAATAWLAMFDHHAHHRPAMVQWMVMTMAMMLPMVAPSIRATAERSLWRRRHRAMAAFLAGYIACWMIVGALFVLAPLPAGPWTMGAALAVAAVWQLTRTKQIALRGCHRTLPLAPQGWQADRDCLGYGWFVGTRCVVSCWALMLVCFVAGHALLPMIGVTTVTAIERYTPLRLRW